MPVYKVNQKQGNRTITSIIEAKSVSNLKAFFEAVSTAKITAIYEVHYEYNGNNFPIDDFNYFKQYKAFADNKNRVTKQILLHNVKKSIDEDKLRALIKTHLEVGGMQIDSLNCRLFMDN